MIHKFPRNYHPLSLHHTLHSEVLRATRANMANKFSPPRPLHPPKFSSLSSSSSSRTVDDLVRTTSSTRWPFLSAATTHLDRFCPFLFSQLLLHFTSASRYQPQTANPPLSSAVCWPHSFRGPGHSSLPLPTPGSNPHKPKQKKITRRTLS